MTSFGIKVKYIILNIFNLEKEKRKFIIKMKNYEK